MKSLLLILMLTLSLQAYWKLSWTEINKDEVNIKDLKEHFNRWNASNLKLIIKKKKLKNTDGIRSIDDSKKKTFEILYFTSKSNASFFRIYILEEINGTLKIEEVNEPIPVKKIVHRKYTIHHLTPNMEYDLYKDSDKYIEKTNNHPHPKRKKINHIYIEESNEDKNKYKSFETHSLSTNYLEQNLNSFKEKYKIHMERKKK